jgi:hypothetical protein
VATVVDELFCNTMEYSGAGWTEVGAEISGTDVALSLRDDGVAFDPFEAGQKDYSLYLASDTDRRLGLYLVTRLARQVDYRREDGVNEVRFVVEAEPPDPGHPRGPVGPGGPEGPPFSIGYDDLNWAELHAADVSGLGALGSLLHFKDHFLPLTQGLEPLHGDRGEVHEDIGAARLLEESEALLFVEPLHAALHFSHKAS